MKPPPPPPTFTPGDWLDKIIAQWGDARVKSEAVWLTHHQAYRWGWVWFPNGTNHGLHFDYDSYGYWTLEAWGQGNIKLESKTKLPNDYQIQAVLGIVFPDVFKS